MAGIPLRDNFSVHESYFMVHGDSKIWHISLKHLVTFTTVVRYAQFVMFCCRLVGYTVRNTFGRVSGQIWLDEVRCSGSESSLGECTHAEWGVHDCIHWEDVAIYCPQSSSLPPNSGRLPFSVTCVHIFVFQVLRVFLYRP